MRDVLPAASSRGRATAAPLTGAPSGLQSLRMPTIMGLCIWLHHWLHLVGEQADKPRAYQGVWCCMTPPADLVHISVSAVVDADAALWLHRPNMHHLQPYNVL
jgi:hypothetical protein